MKIAILTILISLFLIDSVEGEGGGFLVKDYEKFKDNPRLQDYVWGAGDAFLWANGLLRRTKQPKFFCNPERLVLTRQNFLEILENAIDDPEFHVESEQPIASVLFMGLMKTFSCRR